MQEWLRRHELLVPGDQWVRQHLSAGARMCTSSRWMALVLIASCGEASEPAASVPPEATIQSPEMADGEVVDIVALERTGHPAARDLIRAIKVTTPILSRCGDLVRAVVRDRRNEIGFGRVNVTVDAIGKRGQALVVQVLGVEPVFSRESGFSACVESALRGEVPVLASSDYALRARVHLCVGPEPVALKSDAL